jgi:hypothetical protein
MGALIGFVLALAAAGAPPALDPRGGSWHVQLFEESSEGRKPVDERPVDADGA